MRPVLGAFIEVEVAEQDGSVLWKPSQVCELRGGERFVACVNGERDFLEEYGPEDEGTEWRRPSPTALPNVTAAFEAASAAAAASGLTAPRQAAAGDAEEDEKALDLPIEVDMGDEEDEEDGDDDDEEFGDEEARAAAMEEDALDDDDDDGDDDDGGDASDDDVGAHDYKLAVRRRRNRRKHAPILRNEQDAASALAQQARVADDEPALPHLLAHASSVTADDGQVSGSPEPASGVLACGLGDGGSTGSAAGDGGLGDGGSAGSGAGDGRRRWRHHDGTRSRVDSRAETEAHQCQAGGSGGGGGGGRRHGHADAAAPPRGAAGGAIDRAASV